MPALRIDGAAMAAEIRGEVAEGAAEMKEKHGVTPGLAAVLVGDDPGVGDIRAQQAARGDRRGAVRRGVPAPGRHHPGRGAVAGRSTLTRTTGFTAYWCSFPCRTT